MKSKNNYLVCMLSLMLVVGAVNTAYSALPLKVQADLIEKKIVKALKGKKYKDADKLFKEYDALEEVNLPPPLILQRAIMAYHLKQYLVAQQELEKYLSEAEQGSKGYNKALAMYQDVEPKAEAQRKREAEAAEAEAQRKRKAEVQRKRARDTALIDAAKNNNATKAAALIAAVADVNVRDSFKRTPLHWAIKTNGYNALDVVRLLLDHGADVNAKDGNRLTPLHEAVYKNALDVARLLLDYGADVNAKSNSGNTPLGIAKLEKYWKYRKMVRLLKKHGGTK